MIPTKVLEEKLWLWPDSSPEGVKVRLTRQAAVHREKVRVVFCIVVAYFYKSYVSPRSVSRARSVKKKDDHNFRREGKHPRTQHRKGDEGTTDYHAAARVWTGYSLCFIDTCMQSPLFPPRLFFFSCFRDRRRKASVSSP